MHATAAIVPADEVAGRVNNVAKCDRVASLLARDDVPRPLEANGVDFQAALIKRQPVAVCWASCINLNPAITRFQSI